MRSLLLAILLLPAAAAAQTLPESQAGIEESETSEYLDQQIRRNSHFNVFDCGIGQTIINPTITGGKITDGSCGYPTAGASTVTVSAPILGTGAFLDPLRLDSSSVTLQGNHLSLVAISSGVGIMLDQYPYYAACDGVTDDSVDIQACIDASDATDLPCVIPAKTCVSASQLTLKGGSSIIGIGSNARGTVGGAELLMTTNGGGTACGLNSGGAILVEMGNAATILQNLSITSGHAQTKCLINASGTGAGSLVQVGNFHMDQVNVYPHASSTDTIALVVGNNVRLSVTNNYFAPGFRNAIKDLGTFITGQSHIDTNNFDGPLVSSTDYKVILGTNTFGEGVSGITVNGNNWQGTDPRQLRIDGAYNATIASNWFGDVDVDADGAYLIYLDGVSINLKNNAIHANDRNLGHLNAIYVNGDSANIAGNFIDAAWTAITLLGDGHNVQGNDIFTPELAGVYVSTGTSMMVGPNNIQIGGGGRKPYHCDDGAQGNVIYHTLENSTGLSTCEDTNIVHNSTSATMIGYRQITVSEDFNVVSASTFGYQTMLEMNGPGGSVQGSISQVWQHGGAGACYEIELNNLNAGDFRYGTYGDMNVRSCTPTQTSGAYGNINFLSDDIIMMTVGGGTDKGNVWIGSGTTQSRFNHAGSLFMETGSSITLTNGGILDGGDSFFDGGCLENEYLVSISSIGTITCGDDIALVELDGVIGNEVTNTANGTLTRSGAGTAISPYNLALNTGSTNTWTAVIQSSAGIVIGSGTTTQASFDVGGNLRFKSGSNYRVPTTQCAFVADAAPGAALCFDSNGNQGFNFRGTAGSTDKIWGLRTTGLLTWGASAFKSTSSATGDFSHPGNLTTGGTANVIGATDLDSTLNVDGTSRLVGKTGIGTSAAEATATSLHVSGSAASMLTYLSNTNTAGINHLVFNDVIGAGATPAVLSRYGSASASPGRFEMMTYENAPLSFGTNSAIRAYITGTGTVLTGPASVTAALGSETLGTYKNGGAGIMSSSIADQNLWDSYIARGSHASKTAITAGDTFAAFRFRGYVGASNAYVTGAQIDVSEVGAVSDASNGLGGKICFKTRESGANLLERMCIEEDGNILLSNSAQITWTDGTVSTSANSGTSLTRALNATSGAVSNSDTGDFVYAKSIDGTTQSSGCVVAVQMPSDTTSAVMTFTSTDTVTFNFSTNQARPGVLLESCTPPSVCRVGVQGVYHVLAQGSFNNQLPALSGTRCQVAGGGTAGTSAVGYGVTNGGFTAGKWGWLMLK